MFKSDVKVTLVRAKARVAPLNPLSIPRLELMACCIGSRLANSIVNALNLPNLRITFWSDSTTALWWIKEKGVDLLSRGCSPQQMLISRWWEGPLWLRESPEYWPLGETPGDSEEVELKGKKKIKSVQSYYLPDAKSSNYIETYIDDEGILRVKTKILNRDDERSFLYPILLPEKFKSMSSEPTPLPPDRVTDCAPFEIVGIDLAGPLFFERWKKSVDNFVYLRGIPRGRPRTIYCDNGTNFRGAFNDLSKLNWNKIVEETRTPKILWKFIPPTAAWWGGWWERLVRTVKELLKRTLGRSVLKYDELYTVLCDCESIINCRPLTYVSENPEELIPLTPSMFLISNKNSNIEDIEELNSNSLNKRIKYRSKLLKDLRQRFRNEYLSQLIQKHNEKESRDPQIGEVVLVGDNKKRLFWALAKIIELIPGRDGKIRTVRLKTQHGKML
ncbi:integrase catalytic domain-containing protein [Trichonephila clavipes]|uniref:Integrase catalytic domain-containing protein n=1 Tax=Trichonephila clavipes TaxID=2585209 RepID=A0A8X6RHF5_TRICX|nr:integrase catalytic domain-containing protein [Trichonephila clavipes]